MSSFCLRPSFRNLEHFPEKACPGLDPGWIPVFRRKCDRTRNLEQVSSPRITPLAPDHGQQANLCRRFQKNETRSSRHESRLSWLSLTTRSCGSLALLMRYCRSSPSGGSNCVTL